jgi:hypothetical protein
MSQTSQMSHNESGQIKMSQTSQAFAKGFVPKVENNGKYENAGLLLSCLLLEHVPSNS